MKPGRICVVGSINMDLVVRSPRLPRPGETVLGGPFRTSPGGKGANQAVAAQRMQAAVAMVGCVGDDAHGPQLIELLRENGIDTAHVRACPGETTGVALITVDDSTGENTIIVAGGANQRLTADDVEQARDAIARADALLMQLESPLEAVTAATRIARETGTKVVLNAAPAAVLPERLLGALDVLIVNQGEAATLSGRVNESDAVDTKSIAQQLRESGPAAVVVTLGGQGALVVDAQMDLTVPALEVEPVDTVGAGDAFAGALAAGLAQEMSLDEAARLAAAAGSLATMKVGAIPALPQRGEVDARLDS
jgi:ribokinase